MVPLPTAAQLPGEGTGVPVEVLVPVEAPDEVDDALEVTEPETEAAAFVKAISTPVLADTAEADALFK